MKTKAVLIKEVHPDDAKQDFTKEGIELVDWEVKLGKDVNHPVTVVTVESDLTNDKLCDLFTGHGYSIYVEPDITGYLLA